MPNQKQIIKDLENVIKEIQKEIEKLKRENEKPKFERFEYGEKYYCVNTYPKHDIITVTDNRGSFDDKCYNSNNYFHTKERAEQVAKKIKFLLKLERIHDILCPEYEPDWNDYTEDKWYIYYCCYKGKYRVSGVCVTQTETNVYFPDKETAERACIMLNNGEI